MGAQRAPLLGPCDLRDAPCLSGQASVPLAPPRAGGCAYASTSDRASVSQRLADPVPALLARVTCIGACFRGMSTGGLQQRTRARGAAHGGRFWVEATVGERAKVAQAAARSPKRGDASSRPPPPHALYRDAPPPIFGERRRGLDGVVRPGAASPPQARPCKPCATPPQPPHKKFSHQRRLCAARPREEPPQPP